MSLPRLAHVLRRSRAIVTHYLGHTSPMPGISGAFVGALLGMSIVVGGCTAAQGKAAATAALTLGEMACEAFVPLALPQYATEEVFGCKALESGIGAAVNAALPPVVGQSRVKTIERRPILVGGKIAALLPMTERERAAVQAQYDARTTVAAQ